MEYWSIDKRGVKGHHMAYMSAPDAANKRTSLCILAAAASLVIFVVLRARWLGHILTWDEAMNLCAVRALATRSQDHFSNWFWRHPPLFSVLTLTLRPLVSGFAERVEMLAIAVGAVNLALLFVLNRKVFGPLAALLRIFFLAVLPGSMFFDVWVKRDHTVATFGLAALLLLVSRRPLWAGLCLGFALLSKETAVFYAFAAGLLWLGGAAGERSRRSLIALTLTPAVTSAWWYHLSLIGSEPGAAPASWLDRLFGSAVQHVRLAVDAGSGWGRPWNFYVVLMPDMLGVTGLALAGVGVIGLAALCTKHAAAARRSPVGRGLENGGPPPHSSPAAMLWPVAVLVPSYLLLSLLRSKVPWVPMAMFPAWATLQGVALAWLLTWRPAGTGAERVTVPDAGAASDRLNHARISFAALILIATLYHACGRDYDTMLTRIAPGQGRGARWSRDAAVAVNLVTKDDDRVLLTSFHYWHGILPGQACPVFAYYYTKPTLVLMKPHETSFRDLVSGIREHNIDWALLSPAPGEKEREVFGGFIEELKLEPVKLERAWLFRTTGVWEEK